MQAHLDASQRQEAERVRSALERLNAAYSGAPVPGEQESKFVAIVYNPISPEQRQLQWLHGMGTSEGMIPMPARPPQVSEKQWRQAVAENPDPQNFVPQPLVGATALQGRIHWQQERAKGLASHAATLQKSHETIQERALQARQKLEAQARKHAALQSRLLDVMRRVELARCMNLPTQPDELKAFQRLAALHKQAQTLRNTLGTVQSSTGRQPSDSTTLTGVPATSQLLPVLKDHRAKLQTLTTTLQKDQRDASLIQRQLAGSGAR